MAKQAIAIYHSDVVRYSVYDCRILVLINIYLTPLYGQYLSVLTELFGSTNFCEDNI